MTNAALTLSDEECPGCGTVVTGRGEFMCPCGTRWHHGEPLRRRGLVDYYFDDFLWGDTGWTLKVFCERTWTYEGTEGVPALDEIWSHGSTWRRLPVEALPDDFVQAIQDAVEQRWRGEE